MLATLIFCILVGRGICTAREQIRRSADALNASEVSRRLTTRRDVDYKATGRGASDRTGSEVNKTRNEYEDLTSLQWLLDVYVTSIATFQKNERIKRQVVVSNETKPTEGGNATLRSHLNISRPNSSSDDYETPANNSWDNAPTGEVPLDGGYSADSNQGGETNLTMIHGTTQEPKSKTLLIVAAVVIGLVALVAIIIIGAVLYRYRKELCGGGKSDDKESSALKEDKKASDAKGAKKAKTVASNMAMTMKQPPPTGPGMPGTQPPPLPGAPPQPRRASSKTGAPPNVTPASAFGAPTKPGGLPAAPGPSASPGPAGRAGPPPVTAPKGDASAISMASSVSNIPGAK